jgi:hypothetical protein
MCAHRAAPLCDNPRDVDGPVLRDTQLTRDGRRVLLRYMAPIASRLCPCCIILEKSFYGNFARIFYGTSRARVLGAAIASAGFRYQAVATWEDSATDPHSAPNRH